MECSIKITEKQINEMFLNLVPMTEREDLLYAGNNAIVLKPDDLKEINSHLRVESIGENTLKIVERAIKESSISPNGYPLPPVIRKVNIETK